jgi:hypothetical protein
VKYRVWVGWLTRLCPVERGDGYSKSRKAIDTVAASRGVRREQKAKGKGAQAHSFNKSKVRVAPTIQGFLSYQIDLLSYSIALRGVLQASQ